MKKQVNDSLFAVALDGVDLNKEQLANIDKGIKEVVMREIAKVDTGGDLVINQKLEGRLERIDWGGHTMGIWIENIDRFNRR